VLGRLEAVYLEIVFEASAGLDAGGVDKNQL
jgi:hypothetical protein